MPVATATLQALPGRGLALRGSELESRFVGTLAGGVRAGGTYRFPNSFFTYEGAYVGGKKHGAALPPPAGLGPALHRADGGAAGPRTC